jgi:ATP-dependent helicase HrpB
VTGPLPVEAAVAPLRTALADAGVAVLVAPPGAGKTTTIPLELANEPWLRDRKIVMLEPRRLAARAAARRLASNRSDVVGGLVGYRWSATASDSIPGSPSELGSRS